MLSPRAKRNLLRLIPFGIIWLVSGWFFLAVEFAAVEDTSEWADTAIRMDFSIFLFASIAITCVGLVVGVMELLYVNRLFSHVSFGLKILYKVILYGVFFSLIMLVTFPVAASLELGVGIFDPRVWERYLEFLSSKTHFSTMIQMSASLVLSLFYVEISERMGPRILLNFFTGKYHKPVEEERVFMFLDMRSSTTFAEQLGHHRYFELLRAYYQNLTDGIIDHAGEVYQYVGDEVIISWPLEAGVRNANCIRCFFRMQIDMAGRMEWYRKTFGVVPSFKAGLHAGMVTTGEIGEIKKEIFFTGDVLNATSRIQGLCNTYQRDFLISSDLLQHLEVPDTFRIVPIGQSTLRGKEESVELYSIEYVG